MAKATYVDGFVIPLPKKNIAAYKKMAQEGAKMWMKHGALDYKECIMEDPKPKMVKTFFSQLAKAKPSETVVFAYITYKSRAHRDSVNKKVMAEMMKKYSDPKNMPTMPFDEKKMAYGGFQVLVDGLSK